MPAGDIGQALGHGDAGRLHEIDGDQRRDVGNRIIRAGDEPLSPELLIEQIRPTSAVLSFRGQRFSVSQ